MNEERKEQIKRNVKKVALVCVGIGVSVAVGIAIGEFLTDRKVTNALGVVWAKDPTLKDHMWKVANEVLEA